MSYGSLNSTTFLTERRRVNPYVYDEDFIEIKGENFKRGRKSLYSWRHTAIFLLCTFAVIGVFYAKPKSWSSSSEKELFKGKSTQRFQLYDRVQNDKRKISKIHSGDLYILFQEFKSSYHRMYESDEEEILRFEAFKKNIDLINTLNEKNKYALFSINDFADITDDEREIMRMSDKFSRYENIMMTVPEDIIRTAPYGVPDIKTDRNLNMLSKASVDMFTGMVSWISEEDCAACRMYPELNVYSESNMPSSFDWRDYFETPVRNQGGCGSCWTFSAAGDVEGKWFLSTGETVVLSEQQLVACDQNPGLAEGCNGGYPFEAFQYISKVGGLVYEEDYPYERICSVCGENHGTPLCHKNTLTESLMTERVAHIGAWQFVALGERYEDLLATALVKNGPISISLDAYGMEYYQYGIADNVESCDPYDLNHAVLLVGFGVEDGLSYFIIKNSWSEQWGEGGYFRAIRGSNYCGLSNFAVTSVVKSP